MCLKFIKDILGIKDGEESNTDEGDTLEPPKGLDKIGASEINTILKAEFPDATLLFADNNYKTVSKTEFKRFLAANKVDMHKYVSEYYDCDDFSFALMGAIANPDWGALPFGIVWTDIPGGAHAVNCFIDKKREVYLVEPQNDAVFKCPNNWKPYLVMI
jgi:hypothetical protein